MFKTGPRTRKNLLVLGASALVPLSLIFAAGAGANPGSEVEAPAVDDALVCCTEMAVAQQPELNPEVAPDALPDTDLVAATDAPEEAVVVPASYAERSAEALPAGVVSERGLQIKTILVERSVSAEFPQIHTMIGVRPDSKPWHPNGLALDIMIPNSGSAEGIALGDSILAYAMRNAGRFGVQDVIWRGTYYTPGGGASGSGYGHYDHVHITTTGGGYPSGGEEYLAG